MFEAGDGGGGPRAVEVSGPLRSNSGEALRQAALDGLGLALLPAWMVGRDVAAGRLVACLADHRAHPAGYQAAIYAVHARGPAVPAEVAAFVAHLRAALSPMDAD
jgi:DNA-binding transcriptional LysR family regulator